MKLIALLLSLIATSANGGTLHLDKAATGKVRQAADISIADQGIAGGIANCGCAAHCFYADSYAWLAGKLIAIARREQDCERYREYRLNDKNDFIIVKDEIIDSSNAGQQAVENTNAYDWQRHAQTMRKAWE